jgi:hypothetical protein
MTNDIHKSQTVINYKRLHRCNSKKEVRDLCTIMNKFWNLEVDLSKIYETRLPFS